MDMDKNIMWVSPTGSTFNYEFVGDGNVHGSDTHNAIEQAIFMKVFMFSYDDIIKKLPSLEHGYGYCKLTPIFGGYRWICPKTITKRQQMSIMRWCFENEYNYEKVVDILR